MEYFYLSVVCFISEFENNNGPWTQQSIEKSSDLLFGDKKYFNTEIIILVVLFYINARGNTQMPLQRYRFD